MKVGIVGYGFVGKALCNGIADEVDICIIDPKRNTSIKDLESFNPDFIFICVPTPMLDDGSQDISIVNNVISEINFFNKNAIVVLKSTVLPLHVKSILKKSKSLILNPEFLREISANEDFINSSLILFGGDNNNCLKLSDFYKKYTKCKNKNHTFVNDALSASLIKYTINSFLATKVIFFNELKEIFDNSKTNDTWENFTSALSIDSRIGDSHMKVPGPDGRKGFGGPCFPKDTKALLKYSSEIGAEFKLLNEVINTNNTIRSHYNELTSREAEQNINFDKE
ncbi:MAG: hypothetical protein CMD75_01100 [Gammaproteobacteria bacterium]|nr:hypothetical protein [Gammaproteobacteria bacterium]|tara:strand:+ start:2344 stop:3189 length:846 start_codon:yes stop_codon:yes gene_type:complete